MSVDPSRLPRHRADHLAWRLAPIQPDEPASRPQDGPRRVLGRRALWAVWARESAPAGSCGARRHMRVIVCGSRDFDDWRRLREALDYWHTREPFTALAHGDYRGADRLADSWGELRAVPTVPFPAAWKAHGASAGPRRNRKMLNEFKPDLVIAFPGGDGTADMCEIARAAGVRVVEVVA